MDDQAATIHSSLVFRRARVHMAGRVRSYALFSRLIATTVTLSGGSLLLPRSRVAIPMRFLKRTARDSPAESRSKSEDAAADLVARTERIAILDTRGGKISAPRRSILKRAPAPDAWAAPVLSAEV